ncbi:hypothetical protein INR49_006842 [Caranx melampygus]|nr:hypothetical protein INR49_006842 [Caranx melampygus]
MGCALSAEASHSWPDEDDGYDEDDVVQVSLSAQSRQVIKQSWREIQEDISRVGVILFVRGIVGKEAVAWLQSQFIHNNSNFRPNSPETSLLVFFFFFFFSQALILDLGRKHYGYDASPKYYKFVGAEFIQAVGPVLKERWTSEQEEAWKTLFLYISSTMRRGFQQEQRNQNQRDQGDVLRRPPASVSK